MHQDSLEPATIRFTLERLQESARRSGYFSLPFYAQNYLVNCYKVYSLSNVWFFRNSPNKASGLLFNFVHVAQVMPSYSIDIQTSTRDWESSHMSP